MIIIKSLKWSNWFSFGADNYVDFENSKLIQVMGLNGVGKTSIALIIEEILYGKNSKGIKKQSLVNRYLDKPELKAKLHFSKDSDEYTVTLSRRSTMKIILKKNDVDISSHTATNTYKTIQGILGMDFKTFTQLIYQSSKSNLEFLTATDTNRKRFLIALFNLNRYLEIHEHFKKVYTRIDKESTKLSGEVATFSSWVKAHQEYDFETKDIVLVPHIEPSTLDNLTDLKVQASNISKTNADINKNNQYKEILESLDTSLLSLNIEVDAEEKKALVRKGKEIRDKKVALEANVKSINVIVSKVKRLGDVCMTCDQKIDKTMTSKILDENTTLIEDFKKDILTHDNALKVLRSDLEVITKAEKKIEEKRSVSEELVRLTSLIDDELPEDTLDKNELSNEIFEISESIDAIQRNITKITSQNSKAEAHNAKIAVIQDQLDEYRAKLNDLTNEVIKYSDLMDRLNIVKKAFSPTGLLNYKLEYLVKDLEDQINEYLGELSGGKFQLVFVLTGEKLNIEIIDEGHSVTIEELSAGELARINASTLLAIRKLMAAISSTKINILFLDEIMGVLDADGKEKLIDVLTSEKELNTLLVSHEFSHPLIPKLNIVKEKNISRLEHD